MALSMNFTIEIYHEFFFIELSPETKEKTSSNIYIFFCQRSSGFGGVIQREIRKKVPVVL